MKIYDFIDFIFFIQDFLCVFKLLVVLAVPNFKFAMYESINCKLWKAEGFCQKTSYQKGFCSCRTYHAELFI